MSVFLCKGLALRCGVLLGLLATVNAGARSFRLTPDNPTGYLVLEGAAPGDEVLIAPGTYQYRVHLTQSGSHRILLRAEDPSQRPVWDLSGQTLDHWPGSDPVPPDRTGCWLITGGGYDVYGVVFRGCRGAVSAGGSGIYLNHAGAVRVVYSEFDGNQTGIGGTADSLTVEHCHFHQNTDYAFFPEGGGPVTVRYSCLRDSTTMFFSYASDLLLEYNWFARAGSFVGYADSCKEQCGKSPGTHYVQRFTLRGNLFLHGLQGNPFLGLALLFSIPSSFDDTGSTEKMELVAVENTFVGDGPGGNLANELQLRNDLGPMEAWVDNNVFVHVGQLLQVQAGGFPAPVTGFNNWASNTADATGLSATVRGTDPEFVNEAGGDFRPSASSPLRQAAAVTQLGAPEREYFENEVNSAQYRTRSSAVDIGAFAFGTSGPGILTPPPSPDPYPVHLTVGCGCGSSSGPPGLGAWVLLGLLGRARRGREASASMGP